LTHTLPDSYAKLFLTTLNQIPALPTSEGMQPLIVLDQPENAAVQVRLTSITGNSVHVLERFFAVVTPFATLRDDIVVAELQARWRGQGAPLYATADVVELMTPLWGPFGSQLVDEAELLTQLTATPESIGILGFDQLDPRYKVLTVDGINILNNWLEPAKYPLAVAITLEGDGAGAVASLLQPVAGASTNRAASRLTSLLMTGVTAMSRATAARMERMGVLYPVAVISSTFAAADITHVSNEVPFLDDCVVNNTLNNLILCSHTSYWAALQAIGTDIVGLSGNHVNDFGRDGARRSLQFYRDNNIAIYGSGLTVEEACAPLRWQHNGNSFAFIAALAFGPPGAWVTESEPGACYYYDYKEMLLESIRTLAAEVDIVAVELQFEESYNPFPLPTQVREFRELRAAGADIVTGVQSHVPQALEPYGPPDVGGPGIIVYGLGNLFFDQMWSWETRTQLYARHAIYDGRVISTEILTGVLEEYAQPRWATAEERAGILTTIFGAAPARE
jgi:poly-gamma-glutamate synthesis protein (capsule biosynthesis protein)